MIVVDTDVLIEILDKKSEFGQKALSRIKESMEPFAITSLTLHEMLYGKIKKAKDISDALQLNVLSYTKEDATLSASLEYGAEAQGRTVSRIDSMIAAITINYGAKLYTNNTKDFKDFESLKFF
ncbi:MAG: type II toxin-antitoxin system VapC family toxin [Candidatus Micrarchaeota archaeon]|nr:type II toxin-antitoxin system VapC family toxin [Candidatus Micrarchaeota archaeon]